MLKLDHRIYVRISESDIERAKQLATATGLSVSELVRVLLQMQAENIDENAPKAIVLDLLSANLLYREMRHWGYQRNQAVHALNRIAYYLERGQIDAADVLEALDEANRRLEAVEAAADPITASAREVASARLLFLGGAAMPVLKAISGHTSCAGPMRYLTKGGRALAVDLVNIDAPAGERERAAFNWAAVMDATRRSYGNDTPWGGLPCRTYKHYILSPDPKDAISLENLQGLATK